MNTEDAANMLTCTTDSSRSDLESFLTPETQKMLKECDPIEDGSSWLIKPQNNLRMLSFLLVSPSPRLSLQKSHKALDYFNHSLSRAGQQISRQHDLNIYPRRL